MDTENVSMAEDRSFCQAEPDSSLSQKEPVKDEEAAGAETCEDEQAESTAETPPQSAVGLTDLPQGEASDGRVGREDVQSAAEHRSLRQAEPDSSLSQREPMKSPPLAKGGNAAGAAQGGSSEEGAEEPLEEDERSRSHEDEEELLRYYPGFNAATDGADPAFQAMVSAGVPMRRAYEALHLEELISGAMAYASRRTLERLTGAALAGQQRPEEHGLRTGQPAAPVFDPRAMTKEQAKALRDRVFRGEKIYL